MNSILFHSLEKDLGQPICNQLFLSYSSVFRLRFVIKEMLREFIKSRLAVSSIEDNDLNDFVIIYFNF